MKIALLGDIAFIGKYSSMNDPDISRSFGNIKNYLSQFDYIVGNLETPFSLYKKCYGAKSAFLCAAKEAVKALKFLHIDAVNLANNHIYDYGMEGLEFTRRLLEANGINYFGINGINLRKSIGNNKLAFEGFCCYSTNPQKLQKYGNYGINKYDLGGVKGRLVKNHKDGYLNIVSIHAGIEHVNYPSLDHVKASRLLADTCPYIYYGHHPHVIQGVETYNDSLIAHSLGNFCFDDVYTDTSTTKPLIELTENNRIGMVLELTIDNNQIIAWHEQGIYIGKDGTIRLTEIGDILKEYNEKLKHCENRFQDYESFRQQIINKRLSERKAQRNIIWVLKRLRPRYIRLVIDMKRNRKQYVDNVTKYL